jgi:AcrR family transcriptional regulator
LFLSAELADDHSGIMKDTRDRIIAEGLELLAKHGFAGVTLGMLAQQTGLSKSGLFAHFGSKSEVQLQLLNETLEASKRIVIEPALRAAPGLPRLRAMFEAWLGWSEKAGLHGGCAVVGGFFEFDDAAADDPVRARLVAIEAESRGVMVDLTAAAVDAGDLLADLDVDQFVWEMVGIYLNHHVSYRFVHDPKATKRALTAFDGLVRRSSPAPKAKRGRTARAR